MSENVGKQQYRWVPEFEVRIRDGRSHITCPKCNASLGDSWEEKGKRKYKYDGVLMRQFLDDRRNITCPRCSFLLGEMYRLPPTIMDWCRAFNEERVCIDPRLLVTFSFAVAVWIVALRRYFSGYPKEWWGLIVGTLPIFLVLYFFLRMLFGGGLSGGRQFHNYYNYGSRRSR